MTDGQAIGMLLVILPLLAVILIGGIGEVISTRRNRDE